MAKMTDVQLATLVKTASAKLEAGDVAGATALILQIPVSQRKYVMESLAGAIEDKKRKLA